MTNLQKNTVISDKEYEEGHRAHFLGHESELSIPFSVEKLRDLARGHTLSGLDKGYFDILVGSLADNGHFPYNWTPQEQFFVDCNPEDRIVPYLIYRYKFRTLPHLRTVTEVPIHIAIEPASLCNLRCPMCFQTDMSFTQKHPMGLMDVDLFKTIIDQAADGGAGAITIGSRGSRF